MFTVALARGYKFRGLMGLGGWARWRFLVRTTMGLLSTVLSFSALRFLFVFVFSHVCVGLAFLVFGAVKFCFDAVVSCLSLFGKRAVS